MGDDIQASADAIKGLGKNFHDFVTNDIQPALDGLNNITVQAGNFKDGHDVAKDLEQLQTDAAKGTNDVAGGQGDWTGPSAKAFVTFSNNYVGFVQKSALPINGYKGELDNAASALTTAQTNIAAYKKAVEK